jgi:peptidoglycan/LPS O-acetylase OafA/YrhL
MMLLLCHKSMEVNFNPITNKTSMNLFFLEAISVVFRCAYLYTDVFLMLSGLLVTYSLYGKLQKGQKVNFVKEFISRYFRFMPLIAALIIFTIFILPLLGSGPLWNRSIIYQSELCRRNSWRNFLMIHNFFGFENICMENTHHVATDYQLFVVTIFLIALVHMNRRLGVFTVTALATASTVARFHVVYVRELVVYITNGAR